MVGRGRGWGRRNASQLGQPSCFPQVARHLVALAEEPELVDGVLAGEGHRDDLVERAQEEQVLAQLAQQALVVVAGQGPGFLRMPEH